MRSLIVTADDFGAAIEVNEAVEQAHRNGILTAASLMVRGEAAEDAVGRAQSLPDLGVGLHLVLVEGRPVLPPDQVPDLVDSSGHFRQDMVRSAIGMFFLPHVRRQLAAEIEAQFKAFAETGLKLDHVNAHKHFHLHPTISGLILKIGRKFGLKAVRAPTEPAIVPGLKSGVEAYWARRLQQSMKRQGFVVPDAVFGLTWSGAMSSDRVATLIEHLPMGLNEIYMHPATGTYAGSAPGYRYADEFAALLDPKMPGLLKKRDAKLVRFANAA